MRGTRNLVTLGIIVASALCLGAAPAQPAVRNYRIGKAPKPEIVTAGKHIKIDAEARSTKAIRELPPEHFDPVTRRDRVEHFYQDTLKDRIEDARREHKWHCEPYRREFIYWVWSWRVEWRAAWAWHHRKLLDELLWAEWMADQNFAREIASLQAANTAVDPDYMPAELASTSPLVIYTDQYIDAVYNPAPYLAVLNLKNLKTDAGSDWIAAATSDSLLSKLSSVPGLFVADQQQITQAMQQDKTLASDTIEPLQAARIGKAIDVERVVAGSYVADGDKVLLNLRIVNVQTGAVENGISKTIPRDHLLDEMPQLASALAATMGYAPANELVTLASAPPADGTPSVAPRAMAGGSGNSQPPSATPGAAGNRPSIFDDDPPGLPASPPSPPSSPSTGTPAVTPSPAGTPPTAGAAANAPHTISSADKFSGDIAFDGTGGPYEIHDKIAWAQGVKHGNIRVAAGAEIHGGIIPIGAGHLDITGTADRPAVFRDVDFEQYYGGMFKAQYAIFENCKFHKAGSIYNTAGLTAKFQMDRCVIRGTSFPKITHVDYGIKLTDCTFSNVTFGEIIITGAKLDYMNILRKGWRVIDRCRFDNCTVPPTIFWCATASDYTKCTFVPGPAFESDTPTEIVAFVSQTQGDAPDKASLAKPATRAALKVTYATEPFPVFSFGRGK